MNGQNTTCQRLATLLDEVVPHEGVHQTRIEGVWVARHSNSIPRTPMVYEPLIVFVGQGRKRGYLGERVYVYDRSNYLVLAVPLPVECEWEASPEEPLLLTAVKVEPMMLGELILEMDEAPPVAGPVPCGIATTPMNDELSAAVIRLLESLKSLASRSSRKGDVFMK